MIFPDCHHFVPDKWWPFLPGPQKLPMSGSLGGAGPEASAQSSGRGLQGRRGLEGERRSRRGLELLKPLFWGSVKTTTGGHLLDHFLRRLEDVDLFLVEVVKSSEFWTSNRHAFVGLHEAPNSWSSTKVPTGSWCSWNHIS